MSPRTSRPRPIAYARSVPAVERAVSILEHLAQARGGLSLAELTRLVDVSPSSLLAILRTLERRGFVLQDRDRRYRPGLPLLALGAQVPRGWLAVERFFAVARPVADRLRQTISLWALRSDRAVLVAAVEGPSQLRFAPHPGLQWPAVQSALGAALGGASFVDEDSAIEPGLYVAAASIDARPASMPLAVAYVAPHRPSAHERHVIGHELQAIARALSGIPEDEARVEFASVHDPVAGPSPATGPIPPGELDTFLRGPWLASLACLQENGYPYTVPVWYEWDGRRFHVVPHARAEWAAHLRRDPRVSLTIGEPEPPLRRVLVEGLAEALDSPGGSLADEIAERIGRRYLGDGATYGLSGRSLPRWLFAIRPEKMLSWRGLSPHPRYYGNTRSINLSDERSASG